jgi:hypothetical protein
MELKPWNRVAYGVEPKLVNVGPVLVFGKLYAPLSSVFVRLVLPSWDNSFL